MGEYITYNINRQTDLNARITTSRYGLREQIVHYGSLNTFVFCGGIKKIHNSNRKVVTCFHLVPGDERHQYLSGGAVYADIFHTSCEITRKELENLGVPTEKICVIPLGVDLELFKPVSKDKRRLIRKELGIPDDSLVIGSFVKDGVGWGEGFEPKRIKGPDIFIKTVSLLKKYKVFVILTGPARGYVKKCLEQEGIPYKHIYIKEYSKMPKVYSAIDLCLITSRIEGGPKALLEAWGAGVPVVSTKVGMVPDIANNGENILMSDIDDIETIYRNIQGLFGNKNLRSKIIQNASNRVEEFSWQGISNRYYSDMYSKLK